MNKKFNKHLLLNAFLGCAIPTGIINGLIAYFVGHDVNFMKAAMDINITVLFVAFFVSIICIPVMRKLAHTIPEPGIAREDVKLFSMLPTKTLPLALTITFASVVLFGLIPFAALAPFKLGMFSASQFAIFKGIYTGLAAIPANYVATAMAKLTASSFKVNVL